MRTPRKYLCMIILFDLFVLFVQFLLSFLYRFDSSYIGEIGKKLLGTQHQIKCSIFKKRGNYIEIKMIIGCDRTYEILQIRTAMQMFYSIVRQPIIYELSSFERFLGGLSQKGVGLGHISFVYDVNFENDWRVVRQVQVVHSQSKVIASSKHIFKY